MTSKEAEQTLSLIRGMMERSTRYTNLSGHAGIAAGVATLGGCALRSWFNTPFLSTWIGVLIAATAASLYFTAAMARSNGEPPWSRQAQTVALAMSLFTPRAFCLLGVSFMTAGAFTLFLRPINDVLSMGLSFGMIHLVYGAALFVIRRPARAAKLVLQD